MSTLTLDSSLVKPSTNPNRQPELTDSPQRHSLRRAAGFVRSAIRVQVACLTGDRSGRYLPTVGLLDVSKAAAIRLLKRLRSVGGKTIIAYEVGEYLILGATSLLLLVD